MNWASPCKKEPKALMSGRLRFPDSNDAEPATTSLPLDTEAGLGTKYPALVELQRVLNAATEGPFPHRCTQEEGQVPNDRAVHNADTDGQARVNHLAWTRGT